MRSFLLSLTLFPLHAAEFHVAPDGADGNSGEITKPLRTLRAAQGKAKPGDTVWIRGGTYRMAESDVMEVHYGRAHVILLNKGGKEGKPISYLAYKDEKPVFDFSEVKPEGLRVTALRAKASHLHLSGIAFTGVQVTLAGHTQSINVENLGSHNLFERLSMHDGQGIGFWLGGGSNNLVLNCDAYRNYDHTSEGGRGGNTDGFGFHVRKGSTGNVFRGCRAWFNSDDGFDLINTAEAVTVENCWAFYNGFAPDFTKIADGNGFKVGGFAYQPASEIPQPVPRHVIRFCIAANNKASGFYANHHPGGIDWISNTAHRNSSNFNMLGRKLDPPVDVPGYGHLLRNNLGYRSPREIRDFDAAQSDASHNSFDLGLKITSQGFVSLDETELMRERKADGSLPDIGFMKPREGNPAIDAGTDAGFPFKGKAPDLGAFEFAPEPGG